MVQNKKNKIYSQYLRLGILSKGLRVSEAVKKRYKEDIKEPLRTRAGAAGGLELILEDGSWINAPVMEKFSKYSPYSLEYSNGVYLIKEQNGIIEKVIFPKRPEYYDKFTSDGTPMSKIGIMLGDRLAISISNSCIFFGNEDSCKYCSIGLNSAVDLSLKTISQVTETVDAAISEGVVKHIAINAGGFGGEDRGAKTYSKYSRKISENNDIHIAAQLLPPKDLKYVKTLKDAGYSEVTYDMEIFDWDITSRLSPGKAKIGRDHYLKVLETAIDIFGKGNVSSNLIVGLESPESTAKGVESLAKLGVVPKLILFRPLVGTVLEDANPPSIEQMIKTYKLSIDAVTKYGGKLGPSCKACNINRLIIENPIELEQYIKTLNPDNNIESGVKI